MSDVGERIAALRRRIDAAAARAGRRPEDVTLVGVSKRQPAAAIARAVLAGLEDVGESYVQEALDKLPRVEEALRAEGRNAPRWHFIGRLQRNKARRVAERFDVVHTLDRTALGDALDRHAAAADRQLAVLLQIDLDGEPQKGGVVPDDAAALLAASADWPALDVVGLMAIPAASEDPERTRGAFARLRALRDALREAPGGEGLRELSMGMSADFEVAIEEGATIIRVGTAAFGPRDPGGQPA
ncbi:MAG: YggS family pyridoxal phosphate-dependent enzyme [Myxococcota bacterium]